MGVAGLIRNVLGGICLLLSVVSALAYYDRYWRWRDCFNELGRCWDSASEQVYLEQAGIIWGGASGVCLASAIVLLWRAKAARSPR